MRAKGDGFKSKERSARRSFLGCYGPDAVIHEGRRSPMPKHLLLAFILCCCLANAPFAQEAPEPAAPASESPTKTGKERLGPKWTDEQRVNNCNVPPEKRGHTPRSDRCAPGKGE